MPRTTKPLTDSQIQAAKKPEKGSKTIHDGHGLFVEIKDTGSKLWRYRYSHPSKVDAKGNKVRVLMSFGAYPAVSLAEARKRRLQAEALLAIGHDPQMIKAATKPAVIAQQQQEAKKTEVALRFETVAREWLSLRASKVTADYLDDMTRSLELNIFPHIGQKSVVDIVPMDIVTALTPLKAAGKYETIRRICQRVNQVMNHAKILGLIEINKFHGISEAFPAPAEKNLPAIPPAELPEFLADLSTASINLQTRCLIEFQLHTLTRPNEAAGAKWSEIDKEARLWRIPAERMKKRKEHTIPLTDEVMAILATLEPISGHREYVFPSIKDPRKPMNEQTANAAIKRMRAGKYKGRLVAHGLRSIGSTLLNEQGFDPDIVEVALAHVDQNAVRRAYNRAEYLERRRVMMVWWSGYIVECAGGAGSIAGSRRGLRAVG